MSSEATAGLSDSFTKQRPGVYRMEIGQQPAESQILYIKWLDGLNLIISCRYSVAGGSFFGALASEKQFSFGCFFFHKFHRMNRHFVTSAVVVFLLLVFALLIRMFLFSVLFLVPSFFNSLQLTAWSLY